MGHTVSHPLVKDRKFVCRRDVHNPEYTYLTYGKPKAGSLPAKVDHASGFAEVYDQGDLGSCTSQSSLNLFRFEAIKEKCPDINSMSRLQLYYNSRASYIPSTVNEDSGASLGVTLATLSKLGVCDEIDWPYDVTKFKEEPNQLAKERSKYHQCMKYQRVVQTHEQMQACLADGHPFVLGIDVYDSMISNESNSVNTGIMPMPVITTTVVDGKVIQADKLLGGHAICIVGYDTETKLYKFINSWSNKWGDSGFGYLPFDFVANSNLAFDMWTIRLVKSDKPVAKSDKPTTAKPASPIAAPKQPTTAAAAVTVAPPKQPAAPAAKK